MSNKQPRLELNRETVRELGTTGLGEAAGGNDTGTSPAVLTTLYRSLVQNCLITPITI